MRGYIKNDPEANVIMTSLRSIGYTFESAVADVLDNSISAHARNIELIFPRDPLELQCVEICDDGCGMDENELIDAMKYGSTFKADQRPEDDLGRFGMGLKTASLSQCRKLTVISKKEGKINGFVWDLDIIDAKKEWYLKKCTVAEIRNKSGYAFLKRCDHGTVVDWQEFDVLKKSAGNVYAALMQKMDSTADFLSLIFHRFLTREIDPVTIRVNDRELKGLDPFLKNHKKTDVRKPFKIPIEDKDGVERYVDVHPYVLPYLKDLSSKDKKLSGGIENYRTKQGFYIYRNERLIIWGTWFGRHRDELTKYARIQVDIPNSLDDIWGIDIKKQHATIPASISQRLKKAVDDAMDAAVKKEVHRGRIANPDAHKDYIWDRVQGRENKYYYTINRNSMVFELVRKESDSSLWQRMQMVLDEIEKNIPFQQIYIDQAQNAIDIEDDDKERLAELEEKARLLINMSISTGDTKETAMEKLFQTEPFCNHLKLKKILEDKDYG